MLVVFPKGLEEGFDIAADVVVVGDDVLELLGQIHPDDIAVDEFLHLFPQEVDHVRDSQVLVGFGFRFLLQGVEVNFAQVDFGQRLDGLTRRDDRFVDELVGFALSLVVVAGFVNFATDDFAQVLEYFLGALVFRVVANILGQCFILLECWQLPIFRFGYENEKVGVILTGLVPGDLRQASFLTEGPDKFLVKLSATMDHLNLPFGRDKV